MFYVLNFHSVVVALYLPKDKQLLFADSSAIACNCAFSYKYFMTHSGNIGFLCKAKQKEMLILILI